MAATKVDLERDWLDYLVIFAAVLGLIASLVALIVANRSTAIAARAAHDSKMSAEAALRTAGAAEESAKHTAEQLAILREQAARKPNLRVMSLEWRPYRDDRTTRILHVVVFNDGSADAKGTLVNVLVPHGSAVFLAQSTEGEIGRDLVTNPSSQPLVNSSGEPVPADYTWVDFDLDRNLPTNTLFRIRFPGYGTHPVQLAMSHPDAALAYDQTEIELK